MSKRAPLVAIGIPAYNRPRGLRNTLTALCQQAYNNLEIHISDDCSPTPEVEKIALEFCAKDHRVKYHKQASNLGIIKNHQFLLSKMPESADYIMWACDDDDWNPDYIQLCVSELEKHPEAILCVTNSKWRYNEKPHEISHIEEIDTLGITESKIRFKKVLSNILWWNNAFYGVVRRSAYDKIPLQNIFSFDIHFIAILSLFGPFIKLPEPFFTKTMGGHGSNLKRNLDAVKIDDWFSQNFPKALFSFQLIQGIRAIPTLSLWSKLNLMAMVIYMVNSKRMYGKSIKQRFRTIFNKLFENLKLFCAWIKIGNFRLARLVNNHDLHLTDLHYSKKDKSLYSNKTALVLDANSSLFEAYKELSWLKNEHGALFEYSAEQKSNLVTISNISFFLKEGYYSFLLNEVFIKQVYKFDSPMSSVVFDIGANVGMSALYFASNPRVKKVFGFEPFPETAKAAFENFELNPKLKSKIHLEVFGLSNVEETLCVDYSFAASQLASTQNVNHLVSDKPDLKPTEIQLKKASEILLPILNKYIKEYKVLKIDTEGSEYDIIEELNQSQLLTNFNCIMLEWHDKGDQLLIDTLKANSFEISSVDKNYLSIYGDTGMIYAFNRMSKKIAL